jgi:ubiquinone/menaquinone biosynthesis C-methylase UbiE
MTQKYDRADPERLELPAASFDLVFSSTGLAARR